MARPGRPERNRAARSFRQLRRFHHDINSNKVFGTHRSLYRSEHEHVFVWRVGNISHTNNIQLGSYGRNRTNVWHYPGANSFGPGRAEMLELHPTVKPTQLLVDAILDVSKRGEWVLDPFAGSGSTLIAAHQVDRICAAIEIDCHYCDVVVERFERFTGDEARHAMTGRTFSEERSVRTAKICADVAGAAVDDVVSAGVPDQVVVPISLEYACLADLRPIPFGAVREAQ